MATYRVIHETRNMKDAYAWASMVGGKIHKDFYKDKGKKKRLYSVVTINR